jgi:hypothetical protein
MRAVYLIYFILFCELFFYMSYFTGLCQMT